MILTCNHLSNEPNADCIACVVLTLSAERDRLRAEVESLHRQLRAPDDVRERAAIDDSRCKGGVYRPAETLDAGKGNQK